MWHHQIMAKRTGRVHVAFTRRHYKGKTYEAALLRRSYRRTARSRTRPSPTSPPASHVGRSIRQSLRGQRFVEVGNTLTIERSLSTATCKRCCCDAVLGHVRMITSRPCRERDLVMAMIGARLISPRASWPRRDGGEDTTLPRAGRHRRDRGRPVCSDGLAPRSPAPIEKKLAGRHLHAGGMVLYDLSSSYFEGTRARLRRSAIAVTAEGHAAGQLRADLLARGPPGRDLRSRRPRSRTSRPCRARSRRSASASGSPPTWSWSAIAAC